jgi:hypothetical protein
MIAEPVEPIPNASPADGNGPRLLERYLNAARQQGQSIKHSKQAADLCRRFIMFHGKRHPNELGLREIGAFLNHIAATDRNAVVAIELARSALEFLFSKILCRQLGPLPRHGLARPGSSSHWLISRISSRIASSCETFGANIGII